jgi:site-specific recombinase XerD
MTDESAKELGLRLVAEELAGRRYTEGSKQAVLRAIADFYRWASRRGTPDVRSFGKKELCAFFAWLCKQSSKRTGENLAASTTNRRFQAVGLLYSCLYRAGGITENPAHGLELALPKPKCWKRRPLTRDEITRFLESIDVKTAVGLRDRALFELIYSSGLRVSEAAALKVGDIDFESRLMVVRGKFDRDRMVPVSEVARDFLVRYLGDKLERPEAWVFVGMRGDTKGGHLQSTSISERFRLRLREFGMDKSELSTHSIRHSTATHLLENGASVRHVQELLGHRCIESTVRYTHVMVDALGKVYRKHHPREHELYEVVDQDYERRLSSLAGGRGPRYDENPKGQHKPATDL